MYAQFFPKNQYNIDPILIVIFRRVLWKKTILKQHSLETLYEVTPPEMLNILSLDIYT